MGSVPWSVASTGSGYREIDYAISYTPTALVTATNVQQAFIGIKKIGYAPGVTEFNHNFVIKNVTNAVIYATLVIDGNCKINYLIAWVVVFANTSNSKFLSFILTYRY